MDLVEGMVVMAAGREVFDVVIVGLVELVGLVIAGLL